MKKNRYVLCLLLCAFMLYIAVPRLNVFADGLQGAFAISWIALALIVVAGNLSALLYAPKKQRRVREAQIAERKRARSFYR